MREDLAILLTDIPDGTPFSFSLGGDPAVQVPFETGAIGPVAMKLTWLEGNLAGTASRIDQIERALGGHDCVVEWRANIRDMQDRVSSIQPIINMILGRVDILEKAIVLMGGDKK